MSHGILFNNDWYFSKALLGSTVADIAVWSPVELPHDWLIYNTKDLYETGEGWYTKEFFLEDFSAENECIFVRFEGVYMDSSVYVNGNHVRDWKNGYSTFELDLTTYILKGKNTITVRVVHQSPNSRWYSGAGIYRNVWLKRKPTTHIISDSLYISSAKQSALSELWTLWVDLTTVHTNGSTGSHSVRLSIIDPMGEPFLTKAYALSSTEFSAELAIEAPALWDISTPENRYILTAELLVDDTPVDCNTQSFGFRTIEFTPNEGFLLNGRRVELYGVCQHHDLGALGAAMNKSALRRQLALLKEMGTNAIRTAHNMPAVELMDLADEMGFLVCSEALDMWKRSKTPFDFARFFDDCVEEDFKSWIYRDRNHPSLILWSIGNEIYDTHVDEEGLQTTKRLAALVKKYDYRGNAPATIGSNFMPWPNAQACADIVTLAGYNYAERLYTTHHRQYPHWVIYGSETSSVVQSRGIYHFPLAQSVLADDDEQCSSLGNSATSWGAKSMEHCVRDHRDARFVLGQFLWTGTDYIGEPTPYATKNSYFGQLDTAGFPKDSFYFYQSQWVPYQVKPMVHIFPHWDFSKGQMIDIRVCSNAPIIELFFNEKSLGRKKIDHLHGEELIGNWRLPYHPGTLRAVAYNPVGECIAEDCVSSFGDATDIVLAPEAVRIQANGHDLAFIAISMTDSAGNYVANANNRVTVHVTGEGRLLGLDNGDSTDYDQYKGTSRRLFSGKLLAMIAPTYKPGAINILVESEGLAPQTLTLHSVPVLVPTGVSTHLAQNSSSPFSSEIPVRKIELVVENNRLTAEHPTTEVTAILHPANTTYQQLEWRLSDASGIVSNIARLEQTSERKIRITAVGDGEGYIRCSTKNGTEKIKLISQMDFSTIGLGKTFFNPYEFIAGGLYNRSNTEMTNGNDRGVATLRDGESHVGFADIDFGDYGADELTIPIFAMDNSPFTFTIWEGMPGEKGSSALCTVSYEKGSQWNVYHEETYTLPRRLTGITTLCFVLNRKIHIKGFVFKKLEKAYQQLSVATDNSSVYGDSFLLQNGCIEQIGNNVTIEFEGLDFSKAPAHRVIICGRTPLDVNTLQLRRTGEQGEHIELLQFALIKRFLNSFV